MKYRLHNRRHHVPYVVVNEAIHKSKLVNNTDDGRAFRGRHQVKTRRSPLSISSDLPNAQRMDYIVKSKPSVEKRTHHGFIDFDRKTGIIYSLFCDCNDFCYRLYAPMVKHDLSRWDIPDKYKKRMTFKHNREWTKITNPKGKLFVCKHLYFMITKYM